jgi:probable HAF family extracellular repeat protein
MSWRKFISTTLLLTTVSIGSAVAQTPKPAVYNVTDLGTLGGTYSYTYTLSETGIVGGGAATSSQVDGLSQTAFVWQRGQMLGLGTLDGAACPDCSSESAGVSGSGLAAMLSETAAADPNGEDFCAFGTHRQCLAASWQNGVEGALPLLPGGNNSQAYWTNKAGEIVGFSEIGVSDNSCVVPFQKLRFEGVKWGLDGAPHRLAPLPNDTVSFAFGMNEVGQAVGASGLCSDTALPPVAPGGAHAVLWESDGTPVLVGGLPGAVGNSAAAAINNRGDIVGTQALADGSVHAFLWNKSSGVQDVMFPGAFVTVAPCCHVLNDRREITGFAISDSGPQAFVWKNGVFTDLNAALPSGSPWFLFITASMNNAGQIVATGFNMETGEVHGLLLTPIPPTASLIARGATKAPALPRQVTTMLNQQIPLHKNR